MAFASADEQKTPENPVDNFQGIVERLQSDPRTSGAGLSCSLDSLVLQDP